MEHTSEQKRQGLIVYLTKAHLRIKRIKTFNMFHPRCVKGLCLCYSGIEPLCTLLKIAVKGDRTQDSAVRFEPILVFDVCLLFLT